MKFKFKKIVCVLVLLCSSFKSFQAGVFSLLLNSLPDPSADDLDNSFENTVILVSIDGFRPDYLDSGHLPMLERLGTFTLFLASL